MVQGLKDLTTRLSKLKTKKIVMIDDLSEALGLKSKDIQNLGIMFDTLISWISGGGSKADLKTLSDLCKRKDVFKFMHTVFASSTPPYYTYAFDTNKSKLPATGATLLRKKSVDILNFGGSKTTSVPLTDDLLNRQIHTYVKSNAELIGKTFFHNSYSQNKKTFIELRNICSKLQQKCDKNSESFLTYLEDLIDVCHSYNVEEEIFVNISEIKCKVSKVDI